MKTIYEEFDAATKNVSAYAILYKGEFVGKIVFKYGECRVRAFLHIHGLKMVKGIANGGGYDMKSAAASSAAEKLKKENPLNEFDGHIRRIQAALIDDGKHFDGALIDAGYQIFSVV